MTPHEQRHAMILLSFLRLSAWPPQASTLLLLGETPEGLCGLENIIRASIDIAVSGKWLKFQF